MEISWPIAPRTRSADLVHVIGPGALCCLHHYCIGGKACSMAPKPPLNVAGDEGRVFYDSEFGMWVKS